MLPTRRHSRWIVVSAILFGLAPLLAAQRLRVVDSNGVDVGVTGPHAPQSGYL
jgi:hypothetical protein